MRYSCLFRIISGPSTKGSVIRLGDFTMGSQNRKRAALCLEELEIRLCPVTLTYWQPFSYDHQWSNGGNWSDGVPDVTHAAVFDGNHSNENCGVTTSVSATHDIYIRNGYTGTLYISQNCVLPVGNEAYLDNGAGHPVNIDFKSGGKLKIIGGDGGTSTIRDANFTTAGIVEAAGGKTQYIGTDGGITYAGFVVDAGATLQFSN